MKNRVVLAAPAKLNLYLRVIGKRLDGYHLLDTVMLPLSLCDRVEVRRRKKEGIAVTCPGRSELDGEGNLAYRAASLFIKQAGVRCGLSIVIRKRIPVAAGLGGASSDAAAVLRALGKMFPHRLTKKNLHDIATFLGADVPFFLVGLPCRATGIGDQLKPVVLIRQAWVVLVEAPFGLATAEVYRRFDQLQAMASAGRKKRLTERPCGANNTPPVSGAGVDPLAAGYENQLQPAAASLAPAIERVVASMKRAGLRGARVTGSGPTVFCLCETEAEASQKVSSVRLPVGWKAEVCRVAKTGKRRRAQH